MVQTHSTEPVSILKANGVQLFPDMFSKTFNFFLFKQESGITQPVIILASVSTEIKKQLQGGGGSAVERANEGEREGGMGPLQYFQQ